MSGLASINNSTTNNTTNNQFSSTIIYREGEPSPNNINVFSTLLGAIAKAQEIGPQTNVFIDSSLATPTAVASTTYNIDKLNLIGNNNFFTALTLPNGVKFTGSTISLSALFIMSESSSSIIDVPNSFFSLTLDNHL